MKGLPPRYPHPSPVLSVLSSRVDLVRSPVSHDTVSLHLIQMNTHSTTINTLNIWPDRVFMAESIHNPDVSYSSNTSSLFQLCMHLFSPHLQHAASKSVTKLKSCAGTFMRVPQESNNERLQARAFVTSRPHSVSWCVRPDLEHVFFGAGVTFTRSRTTKCQNTTDLEHMFSCCLVSNMLQPEQQSVKIQRTSRLCMCKYDLVHRGQIDFKHNVLVQGCFLPR